MRAIKPLRLGFLTRPFDFAREHRFVVTVLAPFPLREPSALLPEVDLWKHVGKALGRFAMFDAAMWKPRGEVVVSGACFPPKAPALESLVGLSLKSASGKTLVDKTLKVFGDRTWGLSGASPPVPFERMPVDYAHAFGGEGFDHNPIGLGYVPVTNEEGATMHALPNVEDPRRPVSSKRDRPPPASLSPWDPLWPVHFKKMGTHDAKWRDELFPGFAADIDWSVFQVAPEDQRLSAFFEGGESIRLVHMHPDHPVIESRVPEFRARALLRMAGGERLEELPMRLETVHLFPDAEMGCVIHRGVRTIGTRDGSDVELLVVAAEDRDETKPLEHYEEAVRLRSDPERAAIYLFRDRDLLPTSLAGAPLRATLDDPIQDAVELEYLPQKRLRRKAERELEATKRELLESGVEPERVAALALPPVELATPPLDALPDLLDDLAKQVEEAKAAALAEQAEAERQIRATCEEHDIDYDALVEKAKRDAAGPPDFSADAQLAELRAQQELARNAGMDLPHVAAKLADPGLEARLRTAEDEVHRAYRLFGHMQEPVLRLEGERAEEARRELLAAVEAGESLARRDFCGALLEGLDLHGKKLAGIYLEGADLRGANLAGADLTDAMLGRADLSGADLTGATLRGCNLGRATLNKTKLDAVSFEDVTLYEAELVQTSLVGADLTGAQLLEVRFDRVDLRKAKGKRLFFLKSRLKDSSFVDAELEEVMFVEADLTGANFSRATLRKATFYKCAASGAKFLGATLDNVRFVGGCNLEKADFGGAKMPLSNFCEARMIGADLSMAEASQCEFSRAVLEGAKLYRIVAIDSRFSGAELKGANVRGANLRNAVFHGSKIASADFTGSNLFAADFSGAVGDDATSFSECVVDRIIRPRKS